MITLRPSTPADAEGVAACVDAVARERRHLAFIRGFGVDQTRAFLAALAARGGVQIVAL
jgi:hypothetical protein